MSLLNLKQRQLVLFDLDGTLVDTALDMHGAMAMTLAELDWPPVTEQQIRLWVGQGTAKLCDYVLMALFGKIDSDAHQRLLTRYLSNYEANVCVNSQPFEGVINFLKFCQAQQKDMACVTNKPEVLARELLKALNIDHYFTLVIGGDSLKKRKPDPEPLLYCLKHYHVDAAHALMIGDSIHDIEAARRAGIACVAVSYGYNHGEDIRLNHPQEVVARLDQYLT